MSSFANGTNATATGTGSLANGVTASAYGQGSDASGVATTAIGRNSIASATGATAIGTNAQATATNAVALGANSVADQANTVSVGSVGNERRIVNVAPATLSSTSTDAVNGSQLFTANQCVAAAFGGGAGVDGTGQLTAPNYVVQGVSYNNVGSAIGGLDTQVTTNTAGIASLNTSVSNINTNGTKYFQSNSTGTGASATGANAIAVGSNAMATASGALAIGQNSAATGVNAIAIGSGATATGSVAVGGLASAANGGAAFGDVAVATGSNSTALGPNASATFANSTAIGNGAAATAANQVAIGTTSNTYRMPGITSAASRRTVRPDVLRHLRRCRKLLATTSFNPQNISALQNSVATLQGNVGVLQTQMKQAFQGIAAAVATASAPMPSAPGKITWQIRASNFQNEYGVGFGFAYRLHAPIPLNVVGGYGNGGGNQHTAYVGLGGEF